MATSGAPIRDSSVICVLIVKSLEAENLWPQASSQQMACLLDGQSKPRRIVGSSMPSFRYRDGFSVLAASLLLWIELHPQALPSAPELRPGAVPSKGKWRGAEEVLGVPQECGCIASG